MSSLSLTEEALVKRRKLIETAQAAQVKEQKSLMEDRKAAQALVEGAQTRLDELINDSPTGPYLPVQPIRPGANILGMMLLSNIASVIGQNPNYRQETVGMLEREDAQREQAVRTNTGLKREELQSRHKMLMEKQLNDLTVLRDRATILEKYEDAAKYGAKALELSRLQQEEFALEQQAGKEANDRTVQELRNKGDLDVAKVRLLGGSATQFSEKEFTEFWQKTLNDATIKEGVDKGKIKAVAQVKSSLLQARQAGDTFETWSTRLLNAKNLFKSKDRRDLTYLVLKGFEHFGEEGVVTGLIENIGEEETRKVIKSITGKSLEDLLGMESEEQDENAGEGDFDPDAFDPDAPALEPTDPIERARLDVEEADDYIKKLEEYSASGNISVPKETMIRAKRAAAAARRRLESFSRTAAPKPQN